MKISLILGYIFIIFAIFTSSCQPPASCKDNNNCIPPCHTDEECIERGENPNLYCEITKGFEEGYCKINPCKELNINCGEGTCIPCNGGFICECNEGYIYKYNKEANMTTCVKNYCENSTDCFDLSIFDENGQPIDAQVCSPEHKCITTCNSDDDCLDKNEYCYKDRDYDVCVPLSVGESQCNDDSFYYNIYSRTDLTDDPECSPLCENNSDCNQYGDTNFVCDTQRHCVPPCQTDEDCVKDKFSNGNICDTGNHFCIPELPKTVDSESKATEAVTNEFGIENCNIPEEEFFNKTCGNYDISSQKGYEYQNFITVISVGNDNYDYQNNTFRLSSKAEHDSLLERAKTKTRKFLYTNFKDYDFELYNAEIYNGYNEWTPENDYVNQIRLDYQREWGGIPVLGANALFTIDLELNYIFMEIAFLPLEPRERDQGIINELEIQNNQIKQYLTQYSPNAETNSKFAYFIFENGPELVFLLQINTVFYILKRTDYDGSYESVENIVTPHQEDPCNPNPCIEEPHQTICHSVDEGSNYYCECEEGYTENANGETPVCLKEE